MPSKCINFASTALFAIALVLGVDNNGVLGAKNDTNSCQTYALANTTTATCNDLPGVTCSGGCTDYVTAHNCTRSQKDDDEGKPRTTEKCTIGFGKSSASMYICQTEDFSFVCYGPSTGKAQCKGCSKTENSHPDIAPAKNNSSTNNSTSPPPTSEINNTTSSSGNSRPSSASTKGVNVLVLLGASFFLSTLFC